MSNLDVAVTSFWQLGRHWKQGDKAKLELSCEDGTLHIQLSALLGHPDKPHFPETPKVPQAHHHSCKRKSTSQLRRQERRNNGAFSKAAKDSPTKAADTSDKEQTVQPAEVDTEKELSPTGLEFICDQCEYKNVTEKGLRQHSRMKHRISQVAGVTDIEDEDTFKELNYKVKVKM